MPSLESERVVWCVVDCQHSLGYSTTTLIVGCPKMIIPKRKSNYVTKWSLLVACLVGCWWFLSILENAEHHSTPE